MVYEIETKKEFIELLKIHDKEAFEVKWGNAHYRFYNIDGAEGQKRYEFFLWMRGYLKEFMLDSTEESRVKQRQKIISKIKKI